MALLLTVPHSQPPANTYPQRELGDVPTGALFSQGAQKNMQIAEDQRGVREKWLLEQSFSSASSLLSDRAAGNIRAVSFLIAARVCVAWPVGGEPAAPALVPW